MKKNPIHRAYWLMLVMLTLAAILRSQVYELHQNGGGSLSWFIPTRIHPVETFNWGNRIALVLAVIDAAWFVAMVFAAGRRYDRRQRALGSGGHRLEAVR